MIDYKGHSIPASTAAQTALYLLMSKLPFNSVDRYAVGFSPKTYTMSQKYPDSDYHLAMSLIGKYLSQNTA